jgi:hypothetical protein
MTRRLTSPSGHRVALLLAMILVGLASTSLLAQNTPAKINWGNTETPTNPAPGGTFKQTAPAQRAQITQPAQTSVGVKPVQNTSANKALKNVFDMDDKAIIIVSGKKTTAGELKKKIHAEIAKKSGPKKTVKAGARKLDLVALNVSQASLAGTTIQAREKAGRASAFAVVPVVQSTMSRTTPTKPGSLDKSTPVTAVAKTNNSAIDKEAKCLDKGPPRIIQVLGNLKAGARTSIQGWCFGDRLGRVEIIGTFPAGKPVLPVIAWDMREIVFEIPVIRHVTDQTVSVTVVSAEGKSSVNAQAQFVASRERVEVPDGLWSPNASFELSSAQGGNAVENKAYAGQVVKKLRINPQCTLSDMVVDAQAGGINNINGFDQGLTNEASVSIDWVGACINTTTITSHHDFIVQEGDDYSWSSACRASFQARAWAYCPVGIAP